MYHGQMASVRFQVENWAAWAPGLSHREQWSEWLASPSPLPQGGDTASSALSQVPPLLRRRCGFLGRAALATAYECLGERRPCPIVFASRYGEMSRSVELLQQLAEGETLSPASFGLSVHNAIGALFSIARGDHGNHTSVSAGEETIEGGFIEALGLLAESGSDSVLLVNYDAELPEIFLDWNVYTPFSRAFSVLLSLGEGAGFSLTSRLSNGEASESDLPPDLSVLRFLTSQQTIYRHRVGHRTWEWRRHE